MRCFICQRDGARKYDTNIDRLNSVRLCDRCRDRWTNAYHIEVTATARSVEVPPLRHSLRPPRPLFLGVAEHTAVEAGARQAGVPPVEVRNTPAGGRAPMPKKEKGP